MYIVMQFGLSYPSIVSLVVGSQPAATNRAKYLWKETEPQKSP